MKMDYGRPFEKIHFLTRIGLDPGFGHYKVYKWHIDSTSNEKICDQTPSFELKLGMYVFCLVIFLDFSNGVNSVAQMTTI
jgi:hypothetical protein